MKKAVMFLDDVIFRLFEVLFGLLLIFAAGSAALFGPSERKSSEVLVGPNGTLRVGGKLE